MSKTPGLASIHNTGNKELDKFCQGVKQTLDSMTGQAQNRPRLDPLPATATLQDVIARLNEVVARMQG
jgi:hypothetical protein